MTIRAMTCLAVGLTSLSFAACGSPPSLSDEQANELQAAQDDAADAAERVKELEDTVARLERKLESTAEDVGSSEALEDRFSKRLEAAAGRFRVRLDSLRESADGAISAAGSAEGSASAALAEVRDATQELSVLKARYDEHLRRFHGGG